MTKQRTSADQPWQLEEANTVYYRVIDTSGSFKTPLDVSIEDPGDPLDYLDAEDYELPTEVIKVEKVVVDPDVAILCFYWDDEYQWAGDGQFAAFNNEDDFTAAFEGKGHYIIHRPDQA